MAQSAALSGAQAQRFAVFVQDVRGWALSELVGQRAKMTHHRRRHRFEEGDQLLAYAGAQETAVAVRRVLGPGDRVTREVGENVGAPSADQRAQDVVGAWR